MAFRRKKKHVKQDEFQPPVLVVNTEKRVMVLVKAGMAESPLFSGIGGVKAGKTMETEKRAGLRTEYLKH